MDDDFRRFVIAWLDRRGWSQARLAEAAEISQSLVSKHLAEDERRRVKPSWQNLERYAPVLGVAYEDLMRMCGYLPGEPEVSTATDIENDVKARTAELLMALRGAPVAFWPSIIRATYDRAIEGVRDMVSLVQESQPPTSSGGATPDEPRPRRSRGGRRPPKHETAPATTPA